MDEQDWYPIIERETCTGCGECIAICPTGALASQEDKASVTLPGSCTYCAKCEAVCPTGAVSLPYQIVMGSDE